MTLLSPSSGEPGPAGCRIAIETLVRLVEDAYGGDIKHSLLANLQDLREQDWSALPPGGGRAIADIVEHAAWCKWMYEDYAFGAASLAGDLPPLVPENGARARPRDQLLAWLAAGQERWLASVRALADDAELDRLRLAWWGKEIPTRDIIRITIAHDIYHAGEINHLRALLQGTDRWPD